MSDFLKKLNTLVRANLGDVSLPSLPNISRQPDTDAQVTELRERINDALAHEDTLRATVQALHAETVEIDNAIDAAVANGQDAEARHLLTKLQRVQQRLSFAESDLRAHQRSAQELIQKVNLLEATLADNKYVESQQDAPAEEQPASPPDSDDEFEPTVGERAEAAVERVSTLIRDAQARVQARIDSMQDAQDPQPPSPSNEAAAPPQPRATSTPAEERPPESLTEQPKNSTKPDDMSLRRSRLSAPPPEEKK